MRVDYENNLREPLKLEKINAEPAETQRNRREDKDTRKDRKKSHGLNTDETLIKRNEIRNTNLH